MTPKAVPVVEPEKKTSIVLPLPLWQRVKVACIARNTNFTSFLRSAIEHELTVVERDLATRGARPSTSRRNR